MLSTHAYFVLDPYQGRDVRGWNGRRHFFAAAAEAMRRILADRARHRLAFTYFSPPDCASS